ncbi:MAG: hypothetical protein M3447_01675 [Acidobacteriota bacterium]|nr:hypothetical protein [Acidobacteriota bacterium]
MAFNATTTQERDFDELSKILRRMRHRFRAASDAEVNELKTRLSTAVNSALAEEPFDYAELATKLVAEFNKERGQNSPHL